MADLDDMDIRILNNLQRRGRMSNAELAERGIKREDIVRIVFKDSLYL